MQKRKRLFRLALFLSLIALVVSLVINIFLFSQAKSYYLQLNKTNLDPLGLQTFITSTLYWRRQRNYKRNVNFMLKK